MFFKHSNAVLFVLSTETAVNIGFSCKLLTEDLSELFVVDGETEELVDEQLHNMKVPIFLTF